MSIHPHGPISHPFQGQGQDGPFVSAQGVLVVDGHYTHCGQRMQKQASELRQLSAPVFTDLPAGDAIDVYLTARVLRCSCGFQMDLPE